MLRYRKSKIDNNHQSFKRVDLNVFTFTYHFRYAKYKIYVSRQRDKNITRFANIL